jgi:hypothetical protein
MFVFADPQHVTEVLNESAWAPPRCEKLNVDRYRRRPWWAEAMVQSTEIGAVNSWLRNHPAEIVSAAVASLRGALAPYTDGECVRLSGAVWLIMSTPA